MHAKEALQVLVNIHLSLASHYSATMISKNSFLKKELKFCQMECSHFRHKTSDRLQSIWEQRFTAGVLCIARKTLVASWLEILRRIHCLSSVTGMKVEETIRLVLRPSVEKKWLLWSKIHKWMKSERSFDVRTQNIHIGAKHPVLCQSWTKILLLHILKPWNSLKLLKRVWVSFIHLRRKRNGRRENVYFSIHSAGKNGLCSCSFLDEQQSDRLQPSKPNYLSMQFQIYSNERKGKLTKCHNL